MGDINFKAKMTNNTIFKTLLLKGEAGNNIASIAKTATIGATDTYTITLTDGSTTTFNVTNGSNIATIEKTAASGLTDTYTVTLNNGDTSTFEVKNGRGISNVALTSSDNYVDTYTITYNDGTTSTFTVTNGQDYTVPTGGVVAIDDSLPTPTGYEETESPIEVKSYYFSLDNGLVVRIHKYGRVVVLKVANFLSTSIQTASANVDMGLTLPDDCIPYETNVVTFQISGPYRFQSVIKTDGTFSIGSSYDYRTGNAANLPSGQYILYEVVYISSQ